MLPGRAGRRGSACVSASEAAFLFWRATRQERLQECRLRNLQTRARAESVQRATTRAHLQRAAQVRTSRAVAASRGVGSWSDPGARKARDCVARSRGPFLTSSDEVPALFAACAMYRDTWTWMLEAVLQPPTRHTQHATPRGIALPRATARARCRWNPWQQKSNPLAGRQLSKSNNFSR